MQSVVLPTRGLRFLGPATKQQDSQAQNISYVVTTFNNHKDEFASSQTNLSQLFRASSKQDIHIIYTQTNVKLTVNPRDTYSDMEIVSRFLTAGIFVGIVCS